MKLYSYYRSSAAYRVRIALALKGLSYDYRPVHLVAGGGEHLQPAYAAINPQKRVPTLELDDGTHLIQSPAILEFLDERYPEPPLLPADPETRAKCRAMAAIIGCDIHPLNNSSTLAYLKGPFGQDPDAVSAWYAHWVHQGFSAIEQLLGETPFAFGEAPGMADLYLVPQVYNARRFKVPLDAFAKIVAIDARCAEIEAFRIAHPDAQPDAV
ncbi:maleylacetoacetate isomerase/maleylpyruvate isomerase [Rhodobium orientis]|uniref:Maleylacetoacetate isomerase n=1 Tax=Rhodobium orientis TaxID=34017 RepID=A0A327JSS4_9HYPH|nr:maleylacetoacetate isomerase [Rhodobium orientis]MBB4304032.1 maleylacetoacetate isomerase/maleylpyruvate isomerase [Rhodobium orientis]MBK5950759.1 maleylacetoacetate isomerase [Rhodobium orientis]RAI29570.1 maleylacetoacetate isomerase [Rhodobium orientis]